jgi:hypothetical protein
MDKNAIADAVHKIDMMEMLVTVVEQMQANDATPKVFELSYGAGKWFPSSPSIYTSGSGSCGTG